MKAIETYGEFDESGKLTLANSPLLKNKKVKLLILIDEESEIEFSKLSLKGLNNAYSGDEPEYSLSLLNESNSGYAAG